MSRMDEIKKEQSIKEIGETSYTEFEEEVNKKITKEIEERTARVKRIQTLPIDELVEVETKLLDEKFEQELEEEKKHLMKEITILKTLAKKDIENSRVYTFTRAMQEKGIMILPNDLVSHTPEETLNKIVTGLRKQHEISKEGIKEQLQEEKEKYKNIEEEELYEYISLLVKKEILQDKRTLKIAEINLENAKKIDVLNPGGNSPLSVTSLEGMSTTSIEITDFEDLDDGLRKIKENRKKEAGKLIKKILIGGTSLSALCTIICGIQEGSLAALLSLFPTIGASSLILILTVITVGVGIDFLAQELQNKKVRKILEEKGLLEISEEAVRTNKEIDKFEEDHGMKR